MKVGKDHRQGRAKARKCEKERVGSPRPQPGERSLQRHGRRRSRCAGRYRPGNGQARSLVLVQLGGRGEVRPFDRRARAHRRFPVTSWRSCWTTSCKRPRTSAARLPISGRITGNFTQKEVDEIVEIINAGSLPAALEPTPVRDMTTEATLGAETIRQSTYAMIIASIAVPLFMLVYYHFAGLVAVLGPGLEHAHARGLDDPDQGPLHAAGTGRLGPDRGHGGGQQRADLRAVARRTRPRRPPCGWRSATPSIAWAW